MRSGAPTVRPGLAVLISVAVGLGFLLPSAGSADPKPGTAAAPQGGASDTPADPLDEYLRLTRQSVQARAEQRAVELELAVARRSLGVAERRLGARLQALYELGRPDPVQVVLGARSLDDVLGSLDNLERVAAEDGEQVRELVRTRRQIAALAKRLRTQAGEAEARRVRAAAVVRELARRAPTPSPSEAAGESKETPAARRTVASGC